MSRVGKKPILLPKGVEAKIADGRFTVKGPKGSLSAPIPPETSVAMKEGKIVVTPTRADRRGRAFHGLVRSNLQNMVQGVHDLFVKELEIQGVGFRAEMKGKVLQLLLGFSHPVAYPLPEGIEIEVKNQTRLTIRGCDRILVGQTAAEIRGLKVPEPYQGKGIRYLGEVVPKKVGKAAAGAASA